MNTLQLTTSVKKEIWEYKRILLWVPIIIALLIIVLPLLQYVIIDQPGSFWIPRLQHIAESQIEDQFSLFIYGFVSVLFIPFMLVAIIVQLYYFLACLFDERKDMSVIFWRSLPVSDGMSVGVKLLVGAFIIPMIFMIAATVTLIVFLIFAFIGCSILSIGYDISLWSLWANSEVFTSTLSTWLNLLPFAVWLFPLYSWLMLVSMFSSKAPFLLATLPIVILLIIESLVVQYFGLDNRILAQALLEYFSITPGTLSNILPNISDQLNPKVLAFSVLSEKVSIAGIAIGAAFIYGTYWLRVNRSHC